MNVSRMCLADCLDVLGGYPFDSKHFNTSKQGLPVIRIRDVVRGFTETFYSGSYPESAKVKHGDILIGMDGEFNIAPWSGGEALLNQRVCKIVPKENVCDLSYLRFALGLVLKRIEAATPFVTVKHLSMDDIRESELDIPPLTTQRRIASQLEQADRLRRTRRHALELSDDFLPAIFRKLFGDPQTESRWPVVPLGELISYGPQNGLYKPSTSYGTGTRIVRIDAYQNGGDIDLSALKRLQVSDEEIASYGLKPGDFLINRVNSRSHLGKSTRITQMPEPMIFESNMMRFRVDETRLDPAFALHQLQTPFINRQIQKCAKDASNQSSINQDDVEGLGIMLPPLTQQQHFASLVSRHQRLRAIQQESLRQAEHLFQALLKRAFGDSGMASCTNKRVPP